ncbi:MAG: hypothetical protein IPO62_14960 [Saprospiraceae bacterium]|nr:hypothetical protein [Saprospiraceae bacterium]MBK9632336.1 hypothetical protein [Saprospiraceae bacterium]
MYLSRFFYTFLCLLLYLPIRGQFDTIFKTPDEFQIRLLDSIAFKLGYLNKADSAVAIIDKLKTIAEDRKDYRFQIYAELLRIRFSYHTDNFENQKESIRFNQLLNIAKEREDTVMILTMTNRFGDILRDFSKYAMAISYYLVAYKFIPLVDHRLHNINIALLEMQLAAFYYHLGEYGKSLEILSNSKASKTIDYNGMGCYDLWSQICLKLKDYGCSKKMIEKAHSIYLVSDTTSWFFNGWAGIFRGNLGKIEYYQQKYAQSIPLFLEGIEMTSSALMYDNMAIFGLLLAQCYIHTHQEAKAVLLLPMIKESIYHKDDPQLYVDYFKLALVLSPHIQQAPTNLKFLDSIDHYTFKLMERKNKDLKIKEELAMEISAQEHFQSQLQQKVKQQLLLRNVIICLIVFLCFIVILLIYRKQKQLIQQRALTNEISEKASAEVATAQEELNRFKEFLLEKNREIGQLKASLNSKESTQQVEDLRMSVILTDEDWHKFKNLFNRVYPNYLDTLKQKYPQLSQSEIRYFLLHKLELSNKEMASILGVGTGAMRTIKSRIYKKLSLSEEVGLDQLI